MYFQHIENTTPDPWLMAIKRCGYGCVDNGFSVVRTKAYPYCNLHYVLQGSIEVTYKGKVVTIGAGGVFVLPAFEAHAYRSKSANTVLKWLEFDGGESEVLVRQIIDNVCGVALDPEMIDQGFLPLLEASIRRASPIYERSGHIYQLMMGLMARTASVDCCKEERNPLSQAVTYIDNHLHLDIRIQTLAEISGYSPSYLNRVFKKQHGMTPGEFIYQRRIIKAKRLLTDTDLPLSAIAGDCGFYDTPHLIHRFSGSEGVTPDAYRKEIDLYRNVEMDY